MQKIEADGTAYRNFDNAIHNEATRRVYRRNLFEFFLFTKAKSLDQIIKYSTPKIQQILKDWVASLQKKDIKASTIRPKLSSVELFLDMNEVGYHKRIIRKMISSDSGKLGGDVSYTTTDIQQMLKATSKPRTIALIHFLASTGARPAGIVDPVLRRKHLEDMPNGCKAIRIYDESKEGYWSYLTPEATKALNTYFDSRKTNGEILTDESPVFSNILDLTKQTNRDRIRYDYLTTNNLYLTIQKLVKKAGIQRIKKGYRYDKALSYGFRKRFNGILKINNEVNSNIAEKLMAHKKGLDGSYLKPTKEECFAEFKKAIKDLTIDDSERNKFTIQDLQQQNSIFQAESAESAKMKKQIEHDHLIVQVMAKTMKKIGINFEYPDGTPYEIDENLKIPEEYLPEHVKLDESLKDLQTDVKIK